MFRHSKIYGIGFFGILWRSLKRFYCLLPQFTPQLMDVCTGQLAQQAVFTSILPDASWCTTGDRGLRLGVIGLRAFNAWIFSCRSICIITCIHRGGFFYLRKLYPIPQISWHVFMAKVGLSLCGYKPVHRGNKERDETKIPKRACIDAYRYVCESVGHSL